jgi:hypothetical protein
MEARRSQVPGQLRLESEDSVSEKKKGHKNDKILDKRVTEIFHVSTTPQSSHFIFF